MTEFQSITFSSGSSFLEMENNCRNIDQLSKAETQLNYLAVFIGSFESTNEEKRFNIGLSKISYY